jgi:hypothetical protein
MPSATTPEILLVADDVVGDAVEDGLERRIFRRKRNEREREERENRASRRVAGRSD